MKDFDYLRISSINPLYLIIGKVDRFIEENNGNKYLTLVSIDKNKEVFKNTQNLGIKLKIWLNTIPLKQVYEKHFMENKFNSDDNLPLNKMLKIHNMTIVITSVFQEDNKYYRQVFLDECLFEL